MGNILDAGAASRKQLLQHAEVAEPTKTAPKCHFCAAMNNGAGVPASPTNGGFEVEGVYGEPVVPLLAGGVVVHPAS